MTIDNFNGFGVFSPPATSRAHKIGYPFATAARLFGRAGTNLLGRIMRREFAYVGLNSFVAQFYSAVGSGDKGEIPVPPEHVIANVLVCERIASQIRDIRNDG